MSQSVGLWLVGARGGVATVAATGLAALQQGQMDQHGLVTGLPQFAKTDLVDWSQIVVGGHDIRSESLVNSATEFQQSSRAFGPALIDQVRDSLNAMDANIRLGCLHQCGSAIERLADQALLKDQRTAIEKIESIKQDLQEFKQRHDLKRVVVMNVASTEKPVDLQTLPDDWAAAAKNLDAFPSSSLYAIAAFQADCPYINFTPSLGSDCPALHELANQCQLPHGGRDGKTGETLLKSALAPAFAMRNLNVMSWVGHNIFGNMDGQVLDDPENKKTKVDSKDRLLGEILGYAPQSHISIEYIRSLGDWKTAWDHIHFQGFLGTPMIMQFTWQGCDSILAAPLVLDLFRLTERAARDGEVSQLPWLACFFKSPMGTSENNLVHQFRMLEERAAQMIR